MLRVNYKYKKYILPYMFTLFVNLQIDLVILVSRMYTRDVGDGSNYGDKGNGK